MFRRQREQAYNYCPVITVQYGVPLQVPHVYVVRSTYVQGDSLGLCCTYGTCTVTIESVG